MTMGTVAVKVLGFPMDGRLKAPVLVVRVTVALPKLANHLWMKSQKGTDNEVLVRVMISRFAAAELFRRVASGSDRGKLFT